MLTESEAVGADSRLLAQRADRDPQPRADRHPLALRLRISEALALELRGVDLQAGTLRVRHGKGDKSPTVGVDEQTAALRSLERDADGYWSRRDAHGCWSGHS